MVLEATKVLPVLAFIIRLHRCFLGWHSFNRYRYAAFHALKGRSRYCEVSRHQPRVRTMHLATSACYCLNRDQTWAAPFVVVRMSRPSSSIALFIVRLCRREQGSESSPLFSTSGSDHLGYGSCQILILISSAKPPATPIQGQK